MWVALLLAKNAPVRSWCTHRLFLLGGFSLISIYLLDALNHITFSLCFCLMSSGMAPIFSVSPSKAMQAAPSHAGASSAMLGALEMILAAIGASIVTVFHDGTVLPVIVSVGVMMAIVSLAAKLLPWPARQHVTN